MIRNFQQKKKKSIREKSITMPLRNQLADEMYFNKVHEHQVVLTWGTSPVHCSKTEDTFIE